MTNLSKVIYENRQDFLDIKYTFIDNYQLSSLFQNFWQDFYKYLLKQ